MFDNATPQGDDVPVLKGVDLTVRFGGITAVADVSIELRSGEILGLIGPNGAGKTTLFDTLAGSRAPTSGRVFLNGVDVSNRRATWRSRRGVRRTFQRQQMFGWLTVEENVLLALEWRGGGGGLVGDLIGAPTRKRREQARRAQAKEVLQLCGLTELRDVPGWKLPIGRARMVELARAIVDEPRVLLLDEPTSGLQEADTQNVGEVIHRVTRSRGCSVLLVEHDVNFVMTHCDRIVAMNLGQVLAVGSPAEIRANRDVQEAYLG